MKRNHLVFLLCLLMTAGYTAMAGAQGRGQESATISGRMEMPLHELKLTAEQVKQARYIQANYTKKILKSRSDIITRRIEFRSLLRDPAASEDAIRAKGREIEAMDVQLIRDMIEFEIEMRKILTPEQVQLWCNYMDPSSVKRVKK